MLEGERGSGLLYEAQQPIYYRKIIDRLWGVRLMFSVKYP